MNKWTRWVEANTHREETSHQTDPSVTFWQFMPGGRLSIGFWFLDMNPTIVSAVTHLSTAWWEEIRAIKDRHSTRTFPDEEAQTTVPTSSFSFRCPFLDQQRVTVSFLLQFSERQTTRTAKYPGSEAYCNCLTCSLCKHPALTIWRIKLALRFL